ncbi:transposase [Methylomarinum sp. Ch1-1]|uniref:Transposase n=3 Tax=Methylomarinum roseum TaxID=3067653 RepID=A0AAU7NTS5_9GAMM
MQLSNQDLSQIDEDELLNLPEEELRYLSIKLLNDLKEARERLSQNSRNSSRPPSSEAPWDKAATDNTNDQEQTEIDKSAETEDTVTPPSPSKKDQQQSADPNNEHQEPRKPGKQPGAQGFGRTQKLAITHYQDHYPEICACCHQTLEPRHAIAYAAYETINVEWGDVEHPGILVTHTKHTLYEVVCANGHITRKEVSRSSHAQLPGISRTEWRLVGPGLAAMIVCLAYRMRLSRERIQEFLYDWLGIKLSVGTINNTLHESGAAAMPLEDEFAQEIINSELLHVDETSWMEHTTFLWLWVFSTNRVTAYWIATRSAELLENLLGDDFNGWLMSDGYTVYRKYLSRLRCWAHLLRKAKGLNESLNRDAQLLVNKRTIYWLC